METGRISERQLAWLMTTALLATVIYFVPQIAARSVEQDAWLTAAIATVWGIINVLVIMALGRLFPGLTLLEYIPLIIGKPMGKLLGALYAVWFLLIGAFVLRELGMLLNIAVMPETPTAVFTVTGIALVFYAIRSGLEVWTRVNEVLLPIILLAIIAVIVLPVPSMDFRRLLPIADHPIGALLASSFVSASWRGEVFMASMFLPALSGLQRSTRNLVLVVVLVGLILAAIEVAAVATFGGVQTGQLELPVFSLARMINLGKVLDRVEVLIVFTWILGNFVKLCIFMYCFVLGTSQLVGCKQYQFLLFPAAVLFVALADNELQSVAEFTDFLTNVWAAYALLSFELVIPLFLYVVACLRLRSKRRAT
ncbi:MAG TPA: endospore germination permease [Syntrophothermus lipocalidus]|nr:endospore germination permease [Syntrophothermus lipocalidus]HOV43565.1 endospore germination permease [Syntrophothermus lipocalidus]